MNTLITFTTLLLNIVVLMLVEILEAVPPDYCLRNLNKSDCSVSPTHVFSYYKPGSRCEVEVWRGCPTANLFLTESECVYTCISSKDWRYEEGATKFVSENELNEVKCHGPVKINKCSHTATKAFVYNKTTNECDGITWTGCPHKGNVFEEQLDCLQTCYRGDLDWNDKINTIPNNLINELDTMLDKIFVDDDKTNVKQKLLHKIVTKSDDLITKETVKEKVIETKPTTTKHAKNYSYTTVTHSQNIVENKTTKGIDITTELLNYLSTTQHLMTTNKSEYLNTATPTHTTTLETTIRTTEVVSTTPEVTTTTFTSPSHETTATTKSTITSQSTETTQSTTPKTTGTTTPGTTTPGTTTPGTTTSDTTTPSTTRSDTTTPDTTTFGSTTPRAASTETTNIEATTTTTTVEEKQTLITTTLNTGTAKEVVLPQDFY